MNSYRSINALLWLFKNSQETIPEGFYNMPIMHLDHVRQSRVVSRNDFGGACISKRFKNSGAAMKVRKNYCLLFKHFVQGSARVKLVSRSYMQ